MQRYFTHYWRNTTVNGYRVAGDAGLPLDFLVSNLFRSRGVAPGDQVYVISVFEGVLHLVGKLEAAHVCGREAGSFLLSLSEEDLFDGEDVVVAASSTPQQYDLRVPVPITDRLEFFTPEGETRRPVFLKPGRLDNQTLRGVRELTPKSASLLDPLLPSLQPIPPRPGVRDNVLLPEELEEPETQTYNEGAGTRITVNRYERDARARAACIAHYGIACSVCRQSMEDLYGGRGVGYIQVHHLRPLSEIGKQYAVDPVEDLRPVCPNCHAMLHRTDPPCTIEELSQLFEQADWLTPLDSLEYESPAPWNPEKAVPSDDPFVQSVWEYVREHYVQPALEKDSEDIWLNSGHIHDGMRLHGQIRDVCRALDKQDFEVFLPVWLLERTGRPLGANATWRFSLLVR